MGERSAKLRVGIDRRGIGHSGCFGAFAEEKPQLLGSYRDWFAYQVGTGAERQCYVLSQPKQTTSGRHEAGRNRSS